MKKTKRALERNDDKQAGARGAVPWEQAPTELTRHCVLMSVYGDTGTGRTSFALSAPGPIAYIQCAEKYEGIVQPFARDKDIRMVDFSVDLSGTESGSKSAAARADVAWRLLRSAWYDAINGGWARTVVLDTDTDAWELIRLSFFGDLKPAGGRIETNWGPVNAEWKALFKSAKHTDEVNVIVIAQTKDEYALAKKTGGAKRGGMGERTGRTIRAGQKDMGFMSEVIVRTHLDPMARRFSCEIEKPWWNSAALGMEVDNELAEALYGRERYDFATVMALITEEEAEKWEK
jgi:hypothetical protein